MLKRILAIVAGTWRYQKLEIAEQRHLKPVRTRLMNDSALRLVLSDRPTLSQNSVTTLPHKVKYFFLDSFQLPTNRQTTLHLCTRFVFGLLHVNLNQAQQSVHSVRAIRMCAEHVRQLEGGSPFHSRMEAK